jgi:hypothetical protein
MTQQEFIEQNVRMVLGDQALQIIVLKSRIAELEEQAAAVEQAQPKGKANGHDKPPGAKEATTQ